MKKVLLVILFVLMTMCGCTPEEEALMVDQVVREHQRVITPTPKYLPDFQGEYIGIHADGSTLVINYHNGGEITCTEEILRVVSGDWHKQYDPNWVIESKTCDVKLQDGKGFYQNRQLELWWTGQIYRLISEPAQ